MYAERFAGAAGVLDIGCGRGEMLKVLKEAGIEAQGIADFQKIVAQGISTQLLEWKGIEATEKLATSANSKVVIIGNPKNGLPLVLEPK